MSNVDLMFSAASEHFIQYQKSSEARINRSTAERMSAYVTARSTARLPNKGDVVWLLARVGEASPARCRFVYAFVVEDTAIEPDGKRRFTGARGLWMPESELVSDQKWFDDLYSTLGRGGTSIRAIDSVWVDRLRGMFSDQRGSPLDALIALAEEADAKSWPEDARVYRAINERRGQGDFRRRLLAAYEGRCCISGCRVEPLLEAAHIRPHALEPNYDLSNGLLLRADLHTLFDLHLLAIDEFSRVHLSPIVMDGYYKELVNRVGRATAPSRSADRRSPEALLARWELFKRN